MRKPSFISNLIYALKERLGWCPERPIPRAENLGRLDLNKGIQNFKKPSTSLREKGILLLVLLEATILFGIISIYLGQYYTRLDVSAPQESYLFEKSTNEAEWQGNLTIEFPTLHLSREYGVGIDLNFRHKKVNASVDINYLVIINDVIVENRSYFWYESGFGGMGIGTGSHQGTTHIKVVFTIVSVANASEYNYFRLEITNAKLRIVPSLHGELYGTGIFSWMLAVVTSFGWKAVIPIFIPIVFYLVFLIYHRKRREIK